MKQNSHESHPTTVNERKQFEPMTKSAPHAHSGHTEDVEESLLNQIDDISECIATVVDDDTFDTWKDENNFWNPGPPSFREWIKLNLLHSLTIGSGLMRPILGRLAQGTLGILTYHRITEQSSRSRDQRVTEPTINVSPDRFFEQLSGLKRQGFQFVSLDQALAASRDDSASQLPERSVVVTFDDIYDNVFHNAWPVLQQLQIPATVFVSTAFPDSVEPFPFDHWAKQFYGDIPQADWRPIQTDHLNDMLNSDLIRIGAHTHTHQDFRTRPDDFRVDLHQGIQLLQERYNASHVPFAFPYGVPRMGFSNATLMQHVQDAELTCGLTTGSHTNSQQSSPFGWGRFHVFEHDTPASLAAKLDGYYEWLPALKNRLTGHRQKKSKGS